MWYYVLDILLSLAGFYLFCLCMAHVFMYKPNKHFLNEIKTIKHAYIFSILGIGLLFVLEKMNIPSKWLYQAYIGCFLSIAVASFLIMTNKL
jgi:predicted tellurium resistance membrane protein TerC